MAYTDIDKPSDYFNTVLYTGNGGTQSITGVGFQTDWSWIKRRDGSAFHVVTDSVRGATKQIYPNDNQAEGTRAQGLQSFDSDGYTLGNEGDTNASSSTYVGWNWKAGTSFTNDASATGIGSIDSSGSVNQDAGFSIISYTGTGNAATVSHGLGVAPKMIIIKNRSTTNGWEVYHQSIGNTKYLALNVNDAALASASRWNNTSPTSTVFTVNTEGGVNSNGGNLIAYCFANKKGYSKFGSYTGNGSASSGTFCFTGMKPSFVMIKRTDTTGSWEMYDAKREGFNPQVHGLYANGTNAEDNTDDLLDLLSNGFKLYHDGGGLNASGGTYIFAAFASNPFVTSTGVPATAR